MKGILLIDKPSGWTSNDVVQKLKGMLHQRRIGHSGTLDPMATGLLVVFVGRATRAVEFAEADWKRYTASLRLGVTTDTLDIEGKVTATCEQNISAEELTSALDAFKGEISQIPPMYSAIKINGRKLYDIARKGGQVERKPRLVTIHELKLVGKAEGDWLLDVKCSKGTYIRTLCNDIGESLGCGGCLSSLRRVQAGAFSVDNAVTLEQVQQYADEGRAQELLLPVDVLFERCPCFTVTEEAEKRLRVGNSVSTDEADGEYRVYSPSGEFLLLGACQSGALTTIKSFFEV